MTKRTWAGLGGIVLATALGSILGGSNATDAIAQPGPPTLEALIVNDELTPVPVSGDVITSVEGTVQVDGTVDVSSVPAEVTDKLDEIVSEIQQLRNQPDGPAPANYTRTFRDDQVIAGSTSTFRFGTPVLVSFLSISTEDDRGFFTLCGSEGTAGGILCSAQEGSAPFQVGERGKEFPGVLAEITYRRAPPGVRSVLAFSSSQEAKCRRAFSLDPASRSSRSRHRSLASAAANHPHGHRLMTHGRE